MNLIRLITLLILMRLTKLWILMWILMWILNRLTRLIKLMNLIRLKVLTDQMIFIRLMIFVRLMNSWKKLLYAVLLLKMLMKQIIECKALLTESADSYLWSKNINMISKIIFKIKFRLFWFFWSELKFKLFWIWFELTL